LSRTAATIVLVFGLTSISACGGDKPTKAPSRNSAVAHSVGHECRVRVKCNGRVYIRRGAPPVRIRTSKAILRTTIIIDFAGPDDAVIRC
jgi:hypothetical protein